MDGGSTRGVVPLSVLKKLNKHIQDAVDDGISCTKPSDLFDLVVGSSIGGLLAVLLGALQLNALDCMKAFKELTIAAHRYANDVAAFERALKAQLVEILKQKPEWRDFDIDTLKLSDFPPSTEDNKRPHVAVVGRRGFNDAPFCFTNFQGDAGRQHKQDELLYRVLLATCVSPFLFDPITIGELIQHCTICSGHR
jgi:Patatin-like phospholipase